MTNEVTYPDVEVDLVGQDGNAFLIIGRVRKAIKKVHGEEKAKAFFDQALDCESYDDLLRFVMSTVEVN